MEKVQRVWAWGVTICMVILSFVRVCRYTCIGVWFGFVGSALLLEVGTCVVLSFEAMLDLCCFLRVTQDMAQSVTCSEVPPKQP